MSLEDLRTRLEKFPVGRDESIDRLAHQIADRARQGGVLVQMSNGTEWVVPKGSSEADVVSQYQKSMQDV